MAASAHLLIVEPDTGSHIRELPQGRLSIGSGEGADLRLRDTETAALHAEIVFRSPGYLLRRRDGIVLVNGRRAHNQPLQHGDLLTLGRCALSFRSGPPRTELATASEPRSEPHAVDVVRRLCALTGSLSAGAATEQVADRMLADVVELTGAHRGMLLMFDAAGIRTLGAKEAQRGDLDDKDIQLSRTAVAKIREDRRPHLWTDIDSDADLAHAPSIHRARVRSLMTAPILVADELVGALYLVKSETDQLFDQQALDLLAVYANQAALLLDAARREGELADRARRAQRDLEIVRESTVIGSSAAMHQLRDRLRRVAASTIPVLLLGETGTGKELLAREVHRQSDRKSGPFVPVNCGAIPAHLLESELFGHLRGAFTGATQDRAGKLRSAQGGSLFLDEIGEMPLDQQSKLLRVLEDHQVQPVGSDRSHAVDFRLICATNQRLEQRTDEGAFRSDLYYRIAGVALKVPPLRQRDDDAIELAHFFLQRQAVMLQRAAPRLSAAAMTAIRTHRWAGNVRELEGAIRRALVLCDDELLQPEHLGLAPAAASPGDAEPQPREQIVPLTRARDDFLKDYVRRVVEQLGGNRSAAAKALMVTPRTVFKYLEEI